MQEIFVPTIHRLSSSIKSVNLRGMGRLSMLVAKILLPKPGGPTILTREDGIKLRVDASKDSGVEASLYYTGTYENGTLHVLNQILREGDVFVDVGANIGLLSVYAAVRVGKSGKVISFEANPTTKEILEYNIILNNLQNVSIHNYALGAEKSTGKIYANWNINRGGASLIQLDDASETYDIEIKRMDDVDEVSSLNIKAIKVDVEGYELQVLKGAESLLKQTDAPALIVECSDVRENFDSTTADIYTYIRNINSYRIFKLIKGKERPSGLQEIKSIKHLPAHDNIFCFTENWIEKHGLNL